MTPKTTWIPLMLLLLPPILTPAQSHEPPAFRGSEAYVYASAHFPNRSDLNAELIRAKLPQVKDPVLEVGMGGGAFLNRIYLGGSGGFHYGAGNNPRSYTMKWFGGGGVFRIGYTLTHSEKLALYPTLGIGGGGASMTFADEPEMSFHMGYMILDFGANSDLFTSAAFGTNQFLVGISAGYRLHPVYSGWEGESAKYGEPESHGLDGFYARLKIGVAFL